MQVKVMGIEAKSGIGKKSGKPYDGFFMYFSHEKQGVYGTFCGDTFIDRLFVEEKFKAIGGFDKLPGKTVDLDYDGRGFLVGFKVV